jgi:hypothetical protein
MRMDHALETFQAVEIFPASHRAPGATYKRAAGASFELNRKLEVMRAEPSDGATDAMPGRIMQRKLGLPTVLPQQAW